MTFIIKPNLSHEHRNRLICGMKIYVRQTGWFKKKTKIFIEGIEPNFISKESNKPYISLYYSDVERLKELCEEWLDMEKTNVD